MFVPKSGQQHFFSNYVWVSPKRQSRIKKSWAGPFHDHVLPLLMEAEKDFADLYDPDMGAPNKPVATLLGILILKEMNDMTDREALDRFEWDMLWQYALFTPPEEAYIAERTLFYFRSRLSDNERAVDFFKSLVDKIIEKWNIKTGVHRMDSTVIMSNMKILTRLQLFIRTIEAFLKKLRKNHPGTCKGLPPRFHKRYLEREGYFPDAKPSESRRRIEECALDLCDLVNRFRAKKKIRRWDAYRAMERLLEEHVELREDGDGKMTVWFREPKNPDKCADPRGEVALRATDGDTLQNPSDPDATYSGHKGAGYKVELAETCDEDNPFQVIDYVNVAKAFESDQASAAEIHADLKERGHDPETSYADAGYISGENIVEAKDRGIDLVGPIPGKESEEEKKITSGDFEFNDTFTEVKTCPGGQEPVQSQYDEESDTVLCCYDADECVKCPHRANCPARRNGKHRELKLKRAAAASLKRRREMRTVEYKEAYGIRSGAEATISHLKNDRGMRRLRVRGSPRVSLTVIFKTLGENVSRAVNHVLRVMKEALKPPKKALA